MTALILTTLVPFLTASACQTNKGVAKDCDVTYRGIRVEKGFITDVVRAACDVPPQQHALKAQLEIAVGGEWVLVGRSVLKFTIPDRAGYTVPLSVPCREGTYRTHVTVHAVGPQGNGEDFDDAGTHVDIALVQCAQ